MKTKIILIIITGFGVSSAIDVLAIVSIVVSHIVFS